MKKPILIFTIAFLLTLCFVAALRKNAALSPSVVWSRAKAPVADRSHPIHRSTNGAQAPAARSVPPDLRPPTSDLSLLNLRLTEAMSLTDSPTHRHTEASASHASDLMDALCAQNPLPPDIVQLFLNIYRDPDRNIVLRDYALQHLALLHQKLSENSATATDPGIQSQLTQISNTLWDALSETNSSVAGTALLSLHRLSTSHLPAPNSPLPTPGSPLPSPLFSIRYPLSSESLDRVSLAFARDPTVGIFARITAVQICAERRLTAALPFLSEIARADPDITLRTSAIAALGQLGANPEAELLRKIAAENNPRLTPALTLALRRLHP